MYHDIPRWPHKLFCVKIWHKIAMGLHYTSIIQVLWSIKHICILLCVCVDCALCVLQCIYFIMIAVDNGV